MIVDLVPLREMCVMRMPDQPLINCGPSRTPHVLRELLSCKKGPATEVLMKQRQFRRQFNHNHAWHGPLQQSRKIRLATTSSAAADLDLPVTGPGITLCNMAPVIVLSTIRVTSER